MCSSVTPPASWSRSSAADRAVREIWHSEVCHGHSLAGSINLSGAPSRQAVTRSRTGALTWVPQKSTKNPPHADKVRTPACLCVGGDGRVSTPDRRRQCRDGGGITHLRPDSDAPLSPAMVNAGAWTKGMRPELFIGEKSERLRRGRSARVNGDCGGAWRHALTANAIGGSPEASGEVSAAHKGTLRWEAESIARNGRGELAFRHGHGPSLQEATVERTWSRPGQSLCARDRTGKPEGARPLVTAAGTRGG